MTYIPRAVCLRCKKPYKVEKNGVIVHAHAKIGYYYSIETDKWKCPECGHEIIVGFAQRPFNMNYESAGKKPDIPSNREIVDIDLE